MPRLTPFAAIRYTDAAGDPSTTLAPPYDVIDAALAAELRERSPYNAVRLVLPEGSGDARYAAAATQLDEWRRSGVLAVDEAPAVYVYRMRYERGGVPVERLALFGALDLEPLDAGGIFPHEHTHAGPKRDRLSLTLATRTQLSPVFLLGRDGDEALLEALRTVAAGRSDWIAETPDGVDHALWAVEEEGAAAVLCALAGRNPLLIADGHHRYETALQVARQSGWGSAGRVLACVVSDRDPGLIIQPTHRVILDLGDLVADDLPARFGEWFQVTPLGRLDVEEAAAAARIPEGPAAMVVVSGGTADEAGGESPTRETVRLAPRAKRQSSERAAEEQIAAVWFDRHVMGDILGLDADAAARTGRLEYHRGALEAIRRAGAAGAAGAAFLLPAVDLEAVWQATAAGVRLPPKTTYFEPKVPSGILFRPL